MKALVCWLLLSILPIVYAAEELPWTFVNIPGLEMSGSGGYLPSFPDKPMARLGKGKILKIAYSPDGKLLAVAGSVGIWLYDANKLTEVGLLQGHNGPVNSVAFSPDGKILASAGRGIRLWDVTREKEIAVLGNGLWVNSVAFSPDGKTLASGSHDNTVRLWDVDGMTPLQEKDEIAVLRGHTYWVVSVAFSPDGKTLASGSYDDTVRLWNVDGKNEIAVLKGHTDNVTSVAFSPDGKTLASGSHDGTVLLWGEFPTTVYVEPKGKKALTWGVLKRTVLLQNYPNPFNPETWIPFELAEESDVILRIYDAKGGLVREMPLGRKLAGSYVQKPETIYWDGKNDRGQLAASGLYFYTLQAGDYSATRRMVILK